MYVTAGCAKSDNICQAFIEAEYFYAICIPAVVESASHGHSMLRGVTGMARLRRLGWFRGVLFDDPNAGLETKQGTFYDWHAHIEAREMLLF